MRDERPFYIDEWINWHRSIGVEKFLIFDDSSDPPIQPRENVTVVPVYGWFLQLPVYNNALKWLDSQWIAFIDADEFIVPHNYDLQKTLDAYKDFSALGVNWLVFGSNGYKRYVEKPQIEKFTRREIKSNNSKSSNVIKSIVQREKTIGHNLNPHSFLYSEGYCVNENYQEIPSIYELSHQSPHSSEIIQINHYFYRSEEEFREKCRRYAIRNAVSEGYTIGFDEHWAIEPSCNAEEDLLALEHFKKSTPPILGGVDLPNS